MHWGHNITIARISNLLYTDGRERAIKSCRVLLKKNNNNFNASTKAQITEVICDIYRTSVMQRFTKNQPLAMIIEYWILSANNMTFYTELVIRCVISKGYPMTATMIMTMEITGNRVVQVVNTTSGLLTN